MTEIKMNNSEYAKKDLSPEEFRTMTFLTDMFQRGIIKDVDEKTLQKYMANPEQFKDQLQKYAFYQYISNGDIFQLFDLVRILPNLNYKIKTLKVSKSNEKHTLECRMAMKEINHKELTRDSISQTVSTGTLCGVWVGRENPKSKEYPYPIIFDNLEYFFPGRRKNGKWTVWCDLAYFDSAINEDSKKNLIENLSPYVTYEDYQNYKNLGEDFRFIEFPVERSICIRTHTLRRNQRFGIPWNTQSIMDIKHKEKLRNLEKVASNKVMNAVAVLTLGLDDVSKDNDRTYKKLGEKLTKSTFESVKKGLMSNEDGEASVVGLPEWAKLEYPSQKSDVLNPDKMDSINSDIRNSTGISSTLTNGEKGNYASAKLNLDIIFDRIAELLESIENEMYNKLIKIILPQTVSNYYYMEYEKSQPLSNKERADLLKGLHDKGYSLRYLIDLLGIDFDEFIDNSKYEIQDMKLRKIIVPPLNTNNISANDDNVGGRDTDTTDENDNTVKSKEQGGNKNPKPSK